ncbi:MAG: peptidoglycan binding domain-containing protein, partial [Anaerolineae bacterium]
MSKLIRGVTTGLLVLLAASMAVLAVALAYPVVYTHRIYPGVTCSVTTGVPAPPAAQAALGGLTVREAASLLRNSLPDPAGQCIQLYAANHSSQLCWADVGRGHDYLGTATTAFRAGRDGPWLEQVLSPWRIRRSGVVVEAEVLPADPSLVQHQLEELAAIVHTPATDAQLNITAGGVTAVPGQPGEAL